MYLEIPHDRELVRTDDVIDMIVAQTQNIEDEVIVTAEHEM